MHSLMNGMYRLVNVMKMEHDPIANKWEKVPDGTAMFHQFGSDYEEFENGAGNYPVAIIERHTGNVEVVRAEMISFDVVIPCVTINGTVVDHDFPDALSGSVTGAPQ